MTPSETPANRTDQEAPDATLLEDLVDANHILYHQGVLDAFGHVSARHDRHPDRFILSRNMAPGLVRTEDLMTFDLDCRPLHGDTRNGYLERAIHGEIYRSRPDVMAIVHSHSEAVVPFGVVKGARMRPVCHMAGFLGSGPTVFEIRDTAGDATDLLIRTPALGAALARSLADQNVVLMRGHGSTVVATTIRQAVYRAVYTEINARLLLQSLQLGPAECLSPGEAEATRETIEAQSNRPWELWKARARSAAARS